MHLSRAKSISARTDRALNRIRGARLQVLTPSGKTTMFNLFATRHAYMCQLFNCLQWYAGSERVELLLRTAIMLYAFLLGCRGHMYKLNYILSYIPSSYMQLYLSYIICPNCCIDMCQSDPCAPREIKNLLVVPNKVNQWKAFVFFCCSSLSGWLVTSYLKWSGTHFQNIFAIPVLQLFSENSLKLIFFPFKITCTANDWFTGFLLELILIIIWHNIILKLVVSDSLFDVWYEQ